MLGIQELAKCFSNYKVNIIDIRNFQNGCLHLKSACSMCGPDHILVGGDAGRLIANEIIKSQNKKAVESSSSFQKKYKITHIPDAAAANCLYVNGVLIRRAREEFPESVAGLADLKGEQIEVCASELAKVDGALTCCALLF
jgi:N-dimethylarginine dimethylaminohydrolase